MVPKQPVYLSYQSRCVEGERSSARREKLPSVFGAGDSGSSSAFLHVHNGLEQTAGLSFFHLSGVEQSCCVGRVFSDAKAFRAGWGSPAAPARGAEQCVLPRLGRWLGL